MKRAAIVVSACCLAVGLAACSPREGALVGGATGAVIGGVATNSFGGAIVGGAFGALAGAALVSQSRGWCTYRYRGKLYREPCRRW